ncbi:MAG: 2-oxoacid:acceptor oxidoreductase subunit alpha [Thermoplasmata archaeon]
MKINDLAVRIGGQAGDGSLATGEILSKFFRRNGFFVATDKDFPSRIRGGHTSYAIRGAQKEIFSIGDYIDVLLAFDEDSVSLHLDEIESGGLLIYDSSRTDMDIERKDIRMYKMPLANIAKQQIGLELIKNTLALGVLAYLFDFNESLMRETIKDSYKTKNEKIIEENIRAFEVGIEQSKNFEKMNNYKIENAGTGENTLLLMGNEAIGLGAMAAGCKFIAAYPITPASDVLEFLSKHLPERGGISIQAESEISAINMAIGAGYAGLRSMAVTSGPGFDLKTEALGLASMIEQPVVVLDAMRAGPSTGMATKTEQSDIFHAIYGGHGEKARIVIAPGNVDEAFYFTFHAFNLAEKYQLPVIILSDELISWNKQVVKKFNLENLKIDRGKLLLNVNSEGREFKRYEFNDTGISFRPIPGIKNGIHLETGDEHDEYGHIMERIPIRNKMMEKRMKRMVIMKNDLFPAIVEGKGNIAVFGMGSTHGPILEAIDQLKEKNVEVKYIRIRTLNPFLDDIKEHLKGIDIAFFVEQNYTGQLENLVKLNTGFKNTYGIRKYDGRSFKPRMISSRILEVIGR